MWCLLPLSPCLGARDRDGPAHCKQFLVLAASPACLLSPKCWTEYRRPHENSSCFVVSGPTPADISSSSHTLRIVLSCCPCSVDVWKNTYYLIIYFLTYVIHGMLRVNLCAIIYGVEWVNIFILLHHMRVPS